jgi:hypothetical protein
MSCAWYALCLRLTVDCREILSDPEAKKEVPIMQATAIRQSDSQKLQDQYLGFGITVQDGCYVASPMGWTGEVILAESMPQLRRKIWRWWHQV